MAKLAKQALLQLENSPQTAVSSRVNRGNNKNTPAFSNPVPISAQNGAAPAPSNVGLIGNHYELSYQQQQPPRAGYQLVDFHQNRLNANGEAYPDTMEGGRGGPFDPPSLDTSPSAPDFWADGTAIDEIDAFLGNFLDLRSCSYMAQDGMEFLNSLTDIG